MLAAAALASDTEVLVSADKAFATFGGSEVAPGRPEFERLLAR